MPLAAGVTTGEGESEGAPLVEGVRLAVLLVEGEGSGEGVGVKTPLADAHWLVEAVLVLQKDAVPLPAGLPLGVTEEESVMTVTVAAPDAVVHPVGLVLALAAGEAEGGGVPELHCETVSVGEEEVVEEREGANDAVDAPEAVTQPEAVRDTLEEADSQEVPEVERVTAALREGVCMEVADLVPRPLADMVTDTVLLLELVEEAV